MIYNLLLCLGDSLTLGSRDRYYRNYPLELGSKITNMTGEEWYCITEACNKRTSSELARDAYPTISRYSDVYGAILMIGTNDSRCRIPVDVYIDNVRQIVRVCRILGKKIYILTIPTISYHRHFLWYDRAALDLITDYNEALQSVEHARLIDMRGVIVDNDLIDGVHFTHEANVKLADAVAQRLFMKGGDA